MKSILKNFSKISWCLWFVGVIFAFWLILSAGLAGIGFALIGLPLLLFLALLNIFYYRSRRQKDPNQRLKAYSIVDFCLFCLILLFNICILLGAIYISYELLSQKVISILNPTSVPTNYAQCVKDIDQGGEKGYSALTLTAYCSFDGKNFSVPMQIPPGEKLCGSVLCKQVNGHWIATDY